MLFPEPVQAVVSSPTGEPAGASRPDQKRLRNFVGLSPDQPAVASPPASRGQEVAYEGYEFRPHKRVITDQLCELAATPGKHSETTL